MQTHYPILTLCILALSIPAVFAADPPVPLPGPALTPLPAPLPPNNPASPTIAPPAAAQIAPPMSLLDQPLGETLERAFQIAVANDNRVEAGRWNVTSAQSSWSAAQAQRLPSVTFSGDYYALSDLPAIQIDLTPLAPIQAQQPFINRESAGVQGIVTQPLYTSGRISSGIDAAQSSVYAHEADLCSTMLDVKMNVAESFVAVLRATRLVEVAQAKVISLTGHRRDVAALFDKGIVSKNDFLSADVALADAKQQALGAENRLDISRAAYNRALGRNLIEPVRLAELQDDGIRVSPESLTSMALSRRPELAALSAQARALQQQAESERAKKGPQVQVQGGYLYQENDYIEPNGVAGVLFGVQWNAIDMGRSCNAANALDEKAQSVIRLMHNAQSIISLEVRQRWLELETARQRVDVARQAITQADENLRVARDRYQQQVGTNTEVLDAETLRVQAYTNFYDSSYQAILAQLRLKRATGTL